VPWALGAYALEVRFPPNTPNKLREERKRKRERKREREKEREREKDVDVSFFMGCIYMPWGSIGSRQRCYIPMLANTAQSMLNWIAAGIW